MTIPEALRTALAAADDDYLVGLCNKGTVNRAKKDLEKLTPTGEIAGELAVVSIGGETVMLTAPLGKSMCSCPSSAMCRHRIAAMLWLRSQAGEAPKKEPEFVELKAYPAEKLAKQLGSKRVAGVLFRHKSGTGPYIDQGSTVRVDMPWHPAVVRLLEPLEDSTCSCRSRSFCNHKAEGLLFWQLKQGIVKPENLEPEEDDGPDPERTRGVCSAVAQQLSHQLTMGLSRMSPEVCDTLERMAALSHTAGLPELERALRSLHGEYAACFARSAAFRETALLERLARAFHLARAMEHADEKRLKELAGTFKDEYRRAADLKLYELGCREYLGPSGYGGTIYYFLERNTRAFYSFRDLRPNFYDKKRTYREIAPWDLPCTLRKAFGCAFDLKGPRVNDTGNLSANRDSEAVYLGSAKPWLVVPSDMVCRNFEDLLDLSGPERRENERLALVRPERWEPGVFDTVEQVYSMELYDEEGRDLLIEVRYRDQEEGVVRTLEALSKTPEKQPVFFLLLYQEGDRLKGYPIECYADWEVGP